MKYVAFLRAVNVPGRVVKMQMLKQTFQSLRVSNVETFIASGNVIFESVSAEDPATLERRVSAAVQTALGFEVGTYIRSIAELSRIARLEPFPPSALTSRSEIYVGFLPGAPGADERRRLMALATKADDFHVSRREVHWLCRTELVAGRSAGPPIEKALGMRATFRNVRTVRRIADKYCD